jgi:hypothetical protein
MRIEAATFAALLLSASVTISYAQSREVGQNYPNPKEEALITCPGLYPSEAQTSYDFAKATIMSLWFAKAAGEHSAEFKQAAKESNATSYLIEIMSTVKRSTNEFVCAKRAITPFRDIRNSDANSQYVDSIRTAARFMAGVYDKHIDINQQLLNLFKKLGTNEQEFVASVQSTEFADRISTLQVEREQQWDELIHPAEIAGMLLIDMNRADKNGHAVFLVITKEQKRALLDLENEHFPEFRNGTPKEQWSEPAKTVHDIFQTVFEGRKCSDET